MHITAKNNLTKIAKNIVKVCKEDVSRVFEYVGTQFHCHCLYYHHRPQMREIELCPGCYLLTVKQPKDWFCIPCVSHSYVNGGDKFVTTSSHLLSFVFSRTLLIQWCWLKSGGILFGLLR